MDLEIVLLSRASQKEKKQIPNDIIYMWTLKQDINKLIDETERLTEVENRPVVATVVGVGEGWIGVWDFSRCKLLPMEWTDSKVLLSSTGSYLQFL